MISTQQFISFVLLSVCSYFLFVDAKQFCAYFNPMESEGVSGYFAVSIGSGIAQYAYNIQTLNSQLKHENKLKYHIHVGWGLNNQSSTVCDATKGHYDPNFACSGSSEYINSGCTNLSRLAVNYHCNPSVYSAGNYSSCEVGDLSGKFGPVSIATNNVFTSNGVIVDYYPPYAANFEKNLQYSGLWQSIVFHNYTTSKKILCAQFSSVNLEPCQPGFLAMATTTTTTASTDDDGTNQVTKGRFVASVVISVIICLIAGILIGAYSMKFYITATICGPISEENQSLRGTPDARRSKNAGII